MNKLLLQVLLSFWFILIFSLQNTFGNHFPDSIQKKLQWINSVGAKTKPTNPKIYNVKDFGALNDGKTLNTKAIQATIDACSKNGGGVVVFKKGTYLTGSLFLKNGVDLRIDSDVIILGSPKLADYPEINTRVAGIEMKWPAALININDADNVSVSGKGTINANGKTFWESYWNLRKEYEPKGLRWIVDYDCKRPRTMVVANSTNVTVKEITLMQSGFWTIHILYSSLITLDKLTIRNNIGGNGPSTDGIDIDSSSKILVKNCDIDCNDDNFCIKSGRDADGLRVNRPTEFVFISDCISRKGGGLITFGSETSGGMKNIVVQNLTAKGTDSGIRFKSATTRGGTIDSIYIQNIQMDEVNIAVDINLNWNPTYSYSELPKGYTWETLPAHWKIMLQKIEPEEKGIPYLRNIYISDVKVNKSRIAFNVSGLKNSYAQNFHFKNIQIETFKAGKIRFAENWNFENVHIKTRDGEKLLTANSLNMQLE